MTLNLLPLQRSWKQHDFRYQLGGPVAFRELAVPLSLVRLAYQGQNRQIVPLPPSCRSLLVGLAGLSVTNLRGVVPSPCAIFCLLEAAGPTPHSRVWILQGSGGPRGPLLVAACHTNCFFCFVYRISTPKTDDRQDFKNHKPLLCQSALILPSDLAVLYKVG